MLAVAVSWPLVLRLFSFSPSFVVVVAAAVLLLFVLFFCLFVFVVVVVVLGGIYIFFIGLCFVACV